MWHVSTTLIYRCPGNVLWITVMCVPRRLLWLINCLPGSSSCLLVRQPTCVICGFRTWARMCPEHSVSPVSHRDSLEFINAFKGGFTGAESSGSRARCPEPGPTGPAWPRPLLWGIVWPLPAWKLCSSFSILVKFSEESIVQITDRISPSLSRLSAVEWQWILYVWGRGCVLVTVTQNPEDRRNRFDRAL